MSKSLPLVKFPPKTLIHRFGSSNTSPSTALLRFPIQGWTINRSQKEGWAIVGDAEGRRLAVETLLSRHRIYPLPSSPGPFPFLSTITPSSTSTESDPASTLSSYKPIRHLAFSRPPTTGEFTDFTARYGSLQEEDKLSFLQTLNSLDPIPTTEDIKRVSSLMKIEKLLDLPRVSLSSGQTRRARIASALLTKPLLLILEDPMAGLDVNSRKEVSDILGKLNDKGDIRIVLVLRGKGNEELPEWITNIAQVKNGQVWIGNKEEYQNSHTEPTQSQLDEVKENAKDMKTDGIPLIQLRNISVSYGEGARPVLKDVSWTIREGEKWHLIGANGSGKTTLLSLILGHHPRSFSLPSSSLELFSKPRRELPTAILRTLIGHTSPEMFASFPRGMGLSAYSAIGSGFEGVFSRRNISSTQKERILSLLEQVKDLLQPTSLSGLKSNEQKQVHVDVREIALRQFSHFTPSQQGLLLFLRAIVGIPRLLILDEPSQGVDEIIWERCKMILQNEWKNTERGKRMATIVVSHYEDEVPWKKGQGKVLKLDQGVATVE
ncbi:uncharacterized protein IL334_007192 [Kwoniella shivajii]|uniref:ABC transporter domain-containing protein n=1 Tax=Kwoniella shivajii TaxID=564305 RepID=A0ABZ1D8T2_9TREE|nr:hypothetical protein IL334_007192 [Kwoniella shivajii]